MRKFLYFVVTLVFVLFASILYTYVVQLKTTVRPPLKHHDTQLNNIGVWLWYLHHTDYRTHEELSYALADLGVKRIFIKVADGRDLIRWPELRKRNVPKAYEKYHIAPWAWSYNYPGNEVLQAEALYYAAKYGYKSFIVDVEKEFDGRPEAAAKLFQAFVAAKDRAMKEGYIDSTFKIYCTTWGNPRDHHSPLAAIDPYVDGYMPQTYVETWGQNHLDNIAYWINAGTTEYRDMGATKPIMHVASTEYGKMDASDINEFLKHAGPNASIWRIPGGATPKSIWNDWKNVNWDIAFNDSIDRTNKFDIINKDTVNQFFSINYLGKFVKIKVLDSDGFQTKELYYTNKNTYPINDLCKEKYCIEIYHNIRKTKHELDMR